MSRNRPRLGVEVKSRKVRYGLTHCNASCKRYGHHMRRYGPTHFSPYGFSSKVSRKS